MKYYSLRHSVKYKEVGSVPQGGQLAGNLTLDTIRKLPMFCESDEKIQFNVILNNKAKFTDYINQGAFFHPGLLISKNLFEKTNSMNYFKYQSYKVILSIKEIINANYTFIRPVYNDLNYFNLKKSDLFFYTPLDCIGERIIEEKKVKIEIPSIGYISSYIKSNELTALGANILHLNKDCSNRDIFYLDYFDLNTIVISERFLDIIVNNKFTGFEIRELPFEVRFE